MNRVKILLLSAMVLSIFVPMHEAQAEEDFLNIRVSVVQCGERQFMRQMCMKDDRCCVFLDRQDFSNDVLSSNSEFNTRSDGSGSYDDFVREAAL